MLQQEVDRLIDFVINNNIKTKTIKNLGKARFKKTTLETLEERDSRVAAEEAARKLANKNKNINETGENLNPLDLSDEGQTDGTLVDVTELPSTDEEPAINIPVTPVKKKPVKKNEKKSSTPVKKTTFSPLRKIISEEKDDERYEILEKFASLIRDLSSNPYISKDIIDLIVKYYKKHPQLLENKQTNRTNAEGVLGYCFKCYNVQSDSTSRFEYAVSFLTKQQTKNYDPKNLNVFTFQQIGELPGQLLFAFKDIKGNFKTYDSPLTENMKTITEVPVHQWGGNYYDKSTWRGHTEYIVAQCGFPEPENKPGLTWTPFIATAVYAEEVDESMLEYDESLEDNDVPRLRSPIITDTGEPGEDPELEPISSLEEVLEGAGDYKGGWIWLLA